MMTKKTFYQICLLLVCIHSSWSQTVFSENMGSPTTTTTIASNVFENNTSLSYSNGGQSNSADVKDEYIEEETSVGATVAIPSLSSEKSAKLDVIPGSVPHPLDLPKGCKFTPRCKFATDKCRDEEPPLVQVEASQTVRCFYPKKGAHHE